MRFSPACSAAVSKTSRSTLAPRCGWRFAHSRGPTECQPISRDVGKEGSSGAGLSFHIIFNSVSAITEGVGATPIPASLKAAIFAAAVPLPPLTIAPA